MREPEKMAFYAIPGDDGLPRVGHFVIGQQPDGAIEVTEGHAAQLSAELRAREPTKLKAQYDYVTRDEAAEMAIEAAKAAVANFAAEIAKSAGGPK